MKIIWERLTLVRFAQPDEDYKVTWPQVLIGIALFGALLYGPTIFARVLI